MSKRNDKQTLPNTLTIVGGWNSVTISLYLNTYFPCNFHPFRQGFEQFCICCTHVSERNDKPTMPNALTVVGVWNSVTISLYLNTYFPCNFHPFRQGFEQFCICCTHVSKRNDKPTMPNSLTIVGGWNSSFISKHLFSPRTRSVRFRGNNAIVSQIIHSTISSICMSCSLYMHL